jgi:hypothetical protein
MQSFQGSTANREEAHTTSPSLMITLAKYNYFLARVQHAPGYGGSNAHEIAYKLLENEHWLLGKRFLMKLLSRTSLAYS